ncbi:Asp23/Gls24 family envelope stress response protein [Pseudonocardia acidicola]|uniref:Asp23/Gls24 family envelope stress response protein n=1 Tax=Pseudonocardia acidicola TaxID=2724939 RepID=A0ABX1S4H6_9PSEU|nr:Asp23/Gls24 family envelope stress response protein [Pseudonocardia acidicola]
MSTAPAPHDPGDRGRLDIHPTVLRKIIEHTADRVPGTLRNERTLAGIDVGESGASARVNTGAGDPDSVDVRLELTLSYPAPVRSVVDAVRSRVGEELQRLAGYRVRTLAVTVSGLRGAPPPPRLQ